ncbi:MAG: hypothetical protein ABTQ93_03420 [Candidatus Competibacter denitrificans]
MQSRLMAGSGTNLKAISPTVSRNAPSLHPAEIDDMTQHPTMPRYRYPRLRWFGRILGLLYLLVTALFGPIKSLARWLAGQQTVQRYQRGVANLPPSAALALSLLSLVGLEVSKVAVLLSYRYFGLAAAVVVTLCAKTSLGYFAHLTWQAARPRVIAAYPWAARVDAWVMAHLAQLRDFRNRWVAYLRKQPWYSASRTMLTLLRKQTVGLVERIKAGKA